ncbi:hypothetical protein BDF14DRAFT_1852593 [Spinellus fusiger]|nr:hypothetical protein BDF14DRAFT_1852593 [Spinellus fusiger]
MAALFLTTTSRRNPPSTWSCVSVVEAFEIRPFFYNVFLISLLNLIVYMNLQYFVFNKSFVRE